MKTESKATIFQLLAFGILTIASIGDACPIPTCKCNVKKDGGVEIDCSGLGLKTVPKFNSTQVRISEDYSSLVLDNNDITTITPGAFRQFRLKRLSLRDNPLSELSDDSFAGLEPYLLALTLNVDKTKTVKFPWKQIRKFHKLKELHLKNFIVPTLYAAGMNGTALEKLTLESCRIDTIEDGAFLGVHASLRELNLKANVLTEIPTYAMWKLTKLRKISLSNNRIEKLVAYVFLYLHDLAELDLSQNHISNVAREAFDGLGHLEYLGLHINFLTVDSLHALESLVNLEQLNLAMNNIDAIPVGVFSKLNKLAYLNLQENVIGEISKSLLHGPHSQLTVLLLSDNKINEIPPKTFEKFRYLETLYLEGNPLGHGLYNDSFLGLENTLKSLFLDRTKFGGRSWTTLKSLKQLVVLNLCENDMKLLPENAFQGLENLAHLSLCFNNIEAISQQSFYGLDKSMKHIDLSNNRITKIPQCTFYRFTELNSIGLTGNPLQCDCHLSWLRLWVSNLNEAQRLGIDWTCSAPSINKNKLFREIMPYDFRCNHTGLQHDHNALCKQPPSYNAQLTVNNNPAPFLPSLPTVKTIAFKSIGKRSIYIEWQLMKTTPANINFLRIYHQVIGEKDFTKSVPLDPTTRDYVLTNLQPNTEYTICIHVDTENGFYLQWPNCRTVRTAGKETTNVARIGDGSPIGEPNLILIAGCAAGGILVFIVIMTTIIVCVRRRRTELDTSKLAIVTSELESRTTDGSQRYSKGSHSSSDVARISVPSPPYVVEDACKKRIFVSEADLMKADLFRNTTLPVSNSQTGLSASQRSIRFVHDPLPIPPVPPHGVRTLSVCLDNLRGQAGSRRSFDTRSECSTHLYDEICDSNESAYGSRFQYSLDDEIVYYDNEGRIEDTASIHL